MESIKICRVNELPESVRLIIEAQKKLKEQEIEINLTEEDKKTTDQVES